MLRNITVLLLILFFCVNYVCAFNLDETVDDDIRKNYNSSKLIDSQKNNIQNKNTSGEYNLPSLPEITKHIQPAAKKELKPENIPAAQNFYTFKTTRIPAGKKFKVRCLSAISDSQRQGTTLSFVTDSSMKGKNYTIPAKTMFYGKIIESHQPQISCNGGLVVIEIKSMTYKGQRIPVNAYVTRANDKKIFFNNIKGKRTYLKTVYQKGNWGRSLFGRMLNLTVSLGKETSTLILSPFPFVYGTICFGANTLLSPITAFFSKGGHVSIPAHSKFVIKTTSDTWIE